MKAENDCDLVVVGYQEGTGKHEGKMGALLCESRDGKLKVSVGGGYSDDQRAKIKADYTNVPVKYFQVSGGERIAKIAFPSGNPVIGQVIATLYNAKIECNGEWSLFLPRALTGEFRLDKDIADSFDEIKG